MASLRELFNVDGLATREAKEIAIESQAKELRAFIQGLRSRKSQVYTELLRTEVITFNTVITLSSLLLQANLYCRKTHSMLLLKQLFADELAEAIGAFYRMDYLPITEYLKYMKQLLSII
jgi:hypothetical protein